MNSDLPKAAQTRKLNSLPDDLKSIAAEMIAKKFPTKKEEKVEIPDPFRGRTATETAYAQPAYADADRRYAVPPGGNIQVQYDHWSRTYRFSIDHITEEILMSAMRMLDMNNVRGRRVIHASYDDYNTLRRIYAFTPYQGMDMGKIWGMDVVLERGVRYGSYIEVHY